MMIKELYSDRVPVLVRGSPPKAVYRKSGETGRLGRTVWIAALYSLAVAGYPLAALMSQIIGAEESGHTIIAFRTAYILCSGVVVTTFHLKARHLPWDVFMVLYVIFWYMYVIRMVWEYTYGAQQMEFGLEQYIGIGVLSSFMASLAFNFRHSEKDLAKVYKWVLCTLLVSTLGNSYYAMGLSDGGAMSFAVRAGHQKLNPISLGHLASSLALMGLYGLRIEKRVWTRPVIMLSVTLGVIMLIAAASRGPLTAFVAGLGALLVSGGHGRGMKWMKQALVIAMTGGIAFLLVILAPREGGLVLERRMDELFMGTGTLNLRLMTWDHAWGVIADHPIVGYGIEIGGFYPHNIIIEGFLALGVAGGVLMLAVLSLGLYAGFRILVTGTFGGWIGLLMIQYLVGGMFSGSIWGSTTLWALLVASYATWRCTSYSRKHSMTVAIIS